MPFQVEFKLTSIFGRVYPPSTHGQPTYPCHRYGFLWGTEFCTPTRTPEKPVAKPVQFPSYDCFYLPKNSRTSESKVRDSVHKNSVGMMS